MDVRLRGWEREGVCMHMGGNFAGGFKDLSQELVPEGDGAEDAGGPRQHRPPQLCPDNTPSESPSLATKTVLWSVVSARVPRAHALSVSDSETTHPFVSVTEPSVLATHDKDVKVRPLDFEI
eukprot:137025-Rhodomonas_salina.1